MLQAQVKCIVPPGEHCRWASYNLLQAQLGWSVIEGRYIGADADPSRFTYDVDADGVQITDETAQDDDVKSYWHVWNVLPDGTWIDSTADQFGGGEQVRVMPPGDPRRADYLV